MKPLPYSLAATAALALASQMQAAVTITATEVKPNVTLAANGWQGWLITLSSDAATGPIVTVDLHNNPTNFTDTNLWPIGITGPLHQAWVIDNTTNSPDGPPLLVPTPTRIGNVAGTGTVGATATRRDSVFLNAAYFTASMTNSFTEDNNLQNGTNPPFTRSPLVDTQGNASASPPANGMNYGVGSLMTFTGSAAPANASNSLNLAYIILPIGLFPVFDTAGVPLLRGSVYGLNDPNTAIPIVLLMNPEPGSLGLLGLGAISLLARRRRLRRYQQSDDFMTAARHQTDSQS